MLDIARKAILLLGLIHGSHAIASESMETLLTSGHSPSAAYLDRDSLAPGREMNFASIRDDWQEGALQFEFQDSSTLGKIRRIRGFSLLTLAETNQTKLFLGMNRRGLFGLHFSLSRQASADQILEIVRMPYLDRDEAVATVSR